MNEIDKFVECQKLWTRYENIEYQIGELIKCPIKRAILRTYSDASEMELFRKRINFRIAKNPFTYLKIIKQVGRLIWLRLGISLVFDPPDDWLKIRIGSSECFILATKPNSNEREIIIRNSDSTLKKKIVDAINSSNKEWEKYAKKLNI